MAKDLRRPSRGIRVPQGVQQDLASRVRPYLELGPGCLISDGTAALLQGFPLPAELESEPLIHLTSTSGATPRRKHVAGHLRRLRDDEIVEMHGLRLTSPSRTWLDLAAVLSQVDLIVAGDFLVCEYNRGFGRPKKPVVAKDLLEQYIASKARVQGVARARAALPLLQVGVDSPQETRLRLMLQRAGLPDFEVNYPVREFDDEIPTWVDLACPEFRTCIEYEGEHHLTPAKQASDRRRDGIVRDLGWQQVKIYKTDMALGDQWVAAQAKGAPGRRLDWAGSGGMTRRAGVHLAVVQG